MDPEAALREIRTAVAALKERFDASDQDFEHMDPDELVTIAEDTNELLDLIDGLDQWMSRGGFLPTSWAQERKP